MLFAKKEDLPVDPHIDLPAGYSRDEVEPDTDVMDTWATSSVSPQINSHAISKDYAVDFDRHQKLFPADLRPQSHEIIRTWAFGSLVKSMLHEETIPWKNLMISGWVLAADKSKMSKSKGNVVTPIDLIQDKGADVVRYWASTSKLGNDIAYSEDMFKIGKKLVTKLWNAAKFVSLHLQNTDLSKVNIKSDVTYNIDKWLLSKLHHTVKKMTIELDRFEYCDARNAVEDFFWNDFCDNYLELIKVRIYDPEDKDPAGKTSAIATLAFTLEKLLKLFALFLPHVTEELYDIIYNKGESIHAMGTFPDYQQIPYFQVEEEVGADVIDIVNIVRKFKTDAQLSMRAEVAKINIVADKDSEYFGSAAQDFTKCNECSRAII